MAYEIISQNNSVTTLADENGNVITVPARAMLALSETFTLTKVNNNTATLEDSTGKVYRDIPCCIDLSQVTGFSVTKVNNNKATLEDGDGNVYAGVPCIVNLTESGGGGGGTITSLNVTPSTSAQTITASGGVDGYSPVNVAAVDASIDANITADNIKSGVTILGVTGNVIELNGETKTVTPQVYGQTLYPTSPKNAITEITVNAVTSSIDANIQAGNIKKDVTILGVTGTYEAGGGGGTPQPNVKKKISSGTLETDGSEIIDLTGVSNIAQYALSWAYAYATIPSLTLYGSNINVNGIGAMLDMFYHTTFTDGNIDIRAIKTISGDSGCENMFSYAGMTTVDASGIESITSSNGAKSMFSQAPNLTAVNMSNLTVATGINALINLCAYCSNLTSLDLSGLEEMGVTCAHNMLSGCAQVTTMSFPSLRVVTTSSFSSSTASKGAFYNCTGMTAIHFPANIQASIEATNQYANKWGASNATIYFDLPSTFILTGADSNTYKRNPKYDTAGALGWYNSSIGRATPYYTSGTADPSVSNTIYSDSACTTPVTTIDSIA